MPNRTLSQLALAVVVLALPALGGCRNSCQDLCVRMADYAEECGFSVPDSELSTCLDDEAVSTAEERRVCRDYGSSTLIRDEWTCEDLGAYWGAES